MVIYVVAVSFNSSLKAEATPQMIHPHGAEREKSSVKYRSFSARKKKNKTGKSAEYSAEDRDGKILVNDVFEE